MKNKNGFTLIELMIVLAVIAILAVVLIPKAGIIKGQARNAGVTTNVNTIRAYLESKTGDNFITGSDDDTAVSNIVASISNSLSANNEKIVNPLNNVEGVTNAASTGAASAPAVYVCKEAPDLTNYKGSVIVVYTKDTEYKVFGVNNEGAEVSDVTIKK